jgi:hypothetical protein
LRVVRIVGIAAVTAALAAIVVRPVAGARIGSPVYKPTTIQKPCPGGSVRAVIGGKVTCLRSGAACKAKYNSAYRKHGFSCVAGRLARISATPPPPPAPTPPPPIAAPGHYKGMTSQNENFEFDVTSDGGAIANLKSGQVNQDCTPEGGLYAGNLDFGSEPFPLQADASFTIDVTFMSEVGFEDKHTDPDTIHVVITGHFSGALAGGTFLETTQFTEQGTAYSCTSNPQTWSVTKTG